MRKAIVIIGSSYGDEGKGLAAHHAVGQLGLPCLNVLINGGAQRGHTVEFPDGRRHVFHHFGSGSFRGAVSCADEDFIVNPLLFMDEYTALRDSFGLTPEIRISARCRTTLPWDMMLGQIIEQQRGAARHGSCGCGVFETRVRYEETDWALPWGRLATLAQEDFRSHCRRIITEYLPARLGKLDMEVPAEWQAILADPHIIDHAWADVQDMRDASRFFEDFADMAVDFSHLVFEAGQGLALDEDNLADFPHLTPSHTTSFASARRIAALPGETNTELRYVTRTYLTRHGAGPFPTECSVHEIGPDIVDRTNIPNPHQQTLRYGRFDADAVCSRIQADTEAARRILPGAKAVAFITHLNETGGRFTDGTAPEDFAALFDRAYASDSPFDARPL